MLDVIPGIGISIKQVGDWCRYQDDNHDHNSSRFEPESSEKEHHRPGRAFLLRRRRKELPFDPHRLRVLGNEPEAGQAYRFSESRTVRKIKEPGRK